MGGSGADLPIKKRYASPSFKEFADLGASQ
jgi:hypothetical protein